MSVQNKLHYLLPKLLKYSSVKHMHQHLENSRAVRHKSTQALPIYIGLMLHAQTQNKDWWTSFSVLASASLTIKYCIFQLRWETVSVNSVIWSKLSVPGLLFMHRIKTKGTVSSTNSLAPSVSGSGHTVTMIRYSVDIVRRAVELLHAGQTPVSTATLCLGQTNSVAVARGVWRGEDRGNVWWPPHRDGSFEDCW